MTRRQREAVPQGFSRTQVELLAQDLDPSRVRHRKTPDGGQIAYIEGWFVLAEANAIFGPAGWEREIVHFERVFERRSDETSCGYVCRVKITVLAGKERLVREGTGFGHATARSPGDAHELAIKAAETDATKRALSTFGNRFGLGLYGKEGGAAAQGSPEVEDKRRTNGKFAPSNFTLWTPEGFSLAENISAEAFCTGIRQMIGGCDTADMLEGLERHNESQIAQVAALGLKTAKGTLYSDILKRLLKSRRETLSSRRHAGATVSQISGEADLPPEGAPPVSADATTDAPPGLMGEGADITQSEGGESVRSKVDKSVLTIGVERRIRDKEHLRAVAEMPCVICNRQPSHAHHIKFAQKRGLSQKVSDEYVVPLCALHHGDLHRAAREENWWGAHKVDPLPIARELWTRHLALPA